MKNSISAKFISKDQNVQDEQTIYWFDVEGTKNNEEDGVWGVYHTGDESGLLDCDGCPCNTDDSHIAEVFRACVVTERLLRLSPLNWGISIYRRSN